MKNKEKVMIMNTYKKRCTHQLNEWVKDESIHNNVDNECCPDFSCCTPDIITSLEIREAFRDVHKKAQAEEFNPDYHPHYDAEMAMLMGFMGGLVNKNTDKKVYIAGEEIRQIANKN